jgi:hypothetical protein
VYRCYLYGGGIDKEIVTDTALAITGAAAVVDAAVGASRQCITGCSLPNIDVPSDNFTVIAVSAMRGPRTSGGGVCNAPILALNLTRNKVRMEYNYASGGRFNLIYEGTNGGDRTWNTNPFSSDAEFNTGHALGAHYGSTTDPLKACLNDVIQTLQDANTSGPLEAEGQSVVIMDNIGTSAIVNLSMILVLTGLSSDAEFIADCTDPYAYLESPPSIVNINGTNQVRRGQQSVLIDLQNMPNGSTVTAARIGPPGSQVALTNITNTSNGDVRVDIPLGVAMASASSGGARLSVDYE